ncbi:hypothetical protein T439DRAFT_320043 [Meredithblackwellia eburnea MCA 4105]
MGYYDDSGSPFSIGGTLGYMAACCILSALISKRASRTKTNTWLRGWTQAVFVTSLLAVGIQFVVIFGLGRLEHHQQCDLAVLLCIATYGVAKMATFGFLAERVHMADTHGLIPRYKSRAILATICVGAVLAGLGINGVRRRTSFMDEDGDECYIGLHPSASAPYLAFDIVLTLVLSTCFIVPIWRSNFQDCRLLAFKTAIATLISVAATGANIGTVVAQGHESHWVCFMSCSAELFVNALTIYFITNGPNPTDPSEGSFSRRPSLFSPITTAIGSVVPKPAFLFSPRPVSFRWDDIESSHPGTSIDVALPRKAVLAGKGHAHNISETLVAEYTTSGFLERESTQVSFVERQEDLVSRPSSPKATALGLTWEV